MKTGRYFALQALAVLIFSGPGVVTEAVSEEEQALGRLFYTPQQRAALDANVRQAPDTPEKPIVLPPTVTLGGIVTRSDGERTVWVDGRAYHRGNPNNIRVITDPQDPGRAEIGVKGIRARRSVRVGQSLEPVSGTTFERYEARPTPAQVKSPAKSPSDSGAEDASSDTAAQ